MIDICIPGMSAFLNIYVGRLNASAIIFDGYFALVACFLGGVSFALGRSWTQDHVVTVSPLLCTIVGVDS